MLDELLDAKSSITIKKTLRYFKLDDRYNSLCGVTLEEKLREAFLPDNTSGARFSCKNRLRPGRDQMFVNHFADSSPTTDTASYFFGELVSFGDKSRPSAVDQDLDKPVVPIVRVNPPNGKQWTIAPLYFLSKNNHLIVITSQSLKVDSLESYLHWLLCVHAKVTAEPVKFRFACEFDKAVVGEDFSDVTSIKIHDPSKSIDKQPASLFEAGLPQRKAKPFVKRFGLEVANVLRKFLDRAPLPDETYERLSASPNILIDIGFKFERSASPNNANDMIEFLSVFRDIPDELIEVHTKNSHVKDGKIRLQITEDIKTLEDDKSLNPTDAARAMFFYYLSLVDGGKIRP